jgi:hypothetical protein
MDIAFCMVARRQLPLDSLYDNLLLFELIPKLYGSRCPKEQLYAEVQSFPYDSCSYCDVKVP